MKKTLRLISVQLWAALGDMLNIGKRNSKKPVFMQAGLLLFIVLMGYVSYTYNYMLGSALKSFNSLELLPAIMLFAACFTNLITTVFKIKGTVFAFRDYDLLMSLPVSTAAVIASRLTILYVYNMLFTAIIMLPMTVVYGYLAKAGISFYIMSLLLIIFVPFIPLTAASVIGTLIAYIASKFRRNNLLNIIISLSITFLIVGMQFAFRGEVQEIVDFSRTVAEYVYGVYPLARLYTKAITGGDWLAFVMFICISALVFAAYVFLIKLVFVRFNTLLMSVRVRADFKLKEIKTASPFKALYFKELKRYFSSTIYVLNTGVGIELLTISAVAGFFVDIERIFGGEQMLNLLKDYLGLYILFFIMLSSTTMASISLEGKNFWIIKSLPVSPMTVFFSKIAVNLTICLPVLLDALLIGIMFKMSIFRTILLIFIAAAASIFISLYGLIINLMLPNFTWTAEVTAVKQSAATLVTIFSGFGFSIAFFLLVIIIPSAAAAYLACLFILAAASIILYYILKTYGVKRYNELI